jgi:hypothetical protein
VALSEGRDARVIETARQHAELSIDDLWIRCVSLGSMVSRPELEAFLQGEFQLDSHEYNVVAHALNERFMDRDQDSPVPYATSIEG